MIKILLRAMLLLATVNFLMAANIKRFEANSDPDDIAPLHHLLRSRRSNQDNIGANTPRMFGRKKRSIDLDDIEPIRRSKRSVKLPDNYPHQLPMWPKREEHHHSPTRLWGAKQSPPKKSVANSQSMAWSEGEFKYQPLWPEGDFTYGRPRMWGRKRRSVQL